MRVAPHRDLAGPALRSSAASMSLIEPRPSHDPTPPPTTISEPSVTATLSALAAHLRSAQRHGGADREVLDVSHDSRQVGPGWLFCAIRGATTDGHDHAAAAIERGASALLTERRLDVPVPQVTVPSVRAAAGPAAAVVHGHPSAELTVVGPTGTNGKTSCAYLLEAAFGAASRGTGVIGTVETRIHGAAVPRVRTTPEGPDLQRLLRTMRTRGVDAVAMEVSSHGLDLRRVDGTRFAVAVWTNLSQDHLDFHGSMQAYFDAKARLFTPELAERGVVHLDGPWARQLLERAEIPVPPVGMDPDADVRIDDVALDVDGGRARLRGIGVDVTVRTRKPGRFNLLNAATAVLAAVAAGIDQHAAAAGVAASAGAPGRLERIGDGPVTVLVDYAHTPDAVEQVLDTVRRLLEGSRSAPRARGDRSAPRARGDAQVVIVLGCGGDRDRAKRPAMGAAAAGADLAVLTSDNPRSEDPGAILEAMTAGARDAVDAGAPARLSIEPDRRAAIRRALEAAGPEDVVLVAGKGHETGQQLADRTIDFDDREVARELLAERARAEPTS